MASCFPCLSARKKEVPRSAPANPHTSSVPGTVARTFSFEELAAATRNFSDACRIVGREDGLYKGFLKSINQVVAIKLQHAVDPSGSSEQDNGEFLALALMMSGLRHPNIVNLIGFCADGHHRILVHEYMPFGSLEDHLHDSSPGKAPLDWNTWMNIAAGVARGLEYMHDKGVLYRCVKSSDILLGDGYHPKLSQYGLAEHDKGWCTGIAMRTTLGTTAPETAMAGKLLPGSSVYSFGVVLLEMITGRRAIDHTQDAMEHRHLVTWARTMMKDRSHFRRMADPALQGRYPSLDLQEALEVASVCTHDSHAMRAPIGTVVTALSRLAYDVDPPESSHHAAPN
ncbi:hypothetical protein CFC21_104772 [Triticum aestivum]|uniref:Protein kinase domain-containing protein n=2 Tax=Triticum aestivum TaxID=4565 RepID=A0A3B6SLS7_WHEAT|nr:serine/threonine-protein kinase PBL27-like [Triticum aestivum]XP_044432893.1 serine/threonine-protein kinase PBL27-like [Triticum aestivum]KAF7103831.1 hypothetical protein CFC21_104772 [Triticum aestivum]